MTNRPIIFSAPMIRALLEGRKTQTRRLAWRYPTPETPRPTVWLKVWPGDRLWVREAFALATVAPIVETIDKPMPVYRESDGRTDYGRPWKPSIHMPRWASRLTLEVTAARIEPLQAISEADAVAEGVVKVRNGCFVARGTGYDRAGLCHSGPRTAFACLWDEIHGLDAWDANPAVVVITFTVEQLNIDSAEPKRIGHG